MSDRLPTPLDDARDHIERAARLLRAESERREPDEVEVFALREQVSALSRELAVLRQVVNAGRRVVEVYAGRTEGITQDEVAALARAIASLDGRP